jgi:hypothetical protein
MSKDASGWLSLSEAAKRFGVNRATLAGWASGKVVRGKLRTKRGKVRNLVTTLVNVEDVQKIVAAGVRPGRPKSSDRAAAR